MRAKNNYTSEEILKILKERGYFEIRMIPTVIHKLSFQKLEEIVKGDQVKHRGLSYPHIANHNYGKFQRIENYVESFHQWGDTIDIWRFYKSGQFKHFRGFVEDRWDSRPPLGVEWNPEMEKPEPEPRFFEPLVKMWDITEIFLFASRLAYTLDSGLKIEIQLHKMDERQLRIRTSGRSGFTQKYVCRTPTISLNPVSKSSEELQINHDELAADKILEILTYFGWDGGSYISSIIKEEQEKFYSHSF